VQLFSAIGVVNVKNPVHCRTAINFSFANIAGVLIVLGAEFLA
jgi:NADH:ubiquinone oxidoreductase subunit 6 (subunit J)